jgi:hypothetical protein
VKKKSVDVKMESETKFGLRKHHSYDEVVAYIKADPTTIRFPNRAALFLEAHPIYGQLKDSMRSYSEGNQAHAIYMQGDNMAPFDPPKPPMQQMPRDGPNVPPPTDDDDMMPPPQEPARDLLEPGIDPMAQGLGNNGMQPPPPPQPPPANTFAAQVGRAASGFMDTAVGAAAGVVGGAVGNAVLQGVGNIVGQGAGLAEGVLGMGVAAPMAAAAVGAASVATAFMPDIPMQSFQEQRPNDRRDRDQPMRQAAQNNIQGLHNRGRGPAAFVDTRTLNGMNHLKPKDKKLRMGNSKPSTDWTGYTGITGGSSSSASGAVPSGFALPQPSAPEPDLPPTAPPSFNDILGKIKQAPMIGTGTRPRERSLSEEPTPKESLIGLVFCNRKGGQLPWSLDPRISQPAD